MKCWGVNNNGQLGDNTTTQRSTPVNVSGLASGVVAIAAGEFHTCAVTSAGVVKCWGFNTNGQLGDNTTHAASRAGHRQRHCQRCDGRCLPGTAHTCALVSGGVKCWGSNSNGQLGDDTQTQRLTPVDVIGLTSGVTAIAAGALHTCARLDRNAACNAGG